MKKIYALLCGLIVCAAAIAQDYGKTLRLDYIFSGDADSACISLAHSSVSDGWYGRRVNMDRLPVQGNGRLTVRNAKDGGILYASSFSTLFFEWQATPEAKQLRRAFQNTFLVPMPTEKAEVSIELLDVKGSVSASFSHPVDPADILIERKAVSGAPTRYIHKGGDPKDCIDVAIVAEGYTSAESELFFADAQKTVDAILSHEPFGSMRDRFNFIAVACPSADSGVSVPRNSEWKDTACGSNFDTFYSARYLTTGQVFRVHDQLSGLPYEHLIILANTDTYGGGGIYNFYTLTTAHHSMFEPVVVHEFGHSFGALADEYSYAGEEDPYYTPDVEPWEQNITTKADFSSKWEDMLGVPGVGIFEGAGYQAKGVWRPAEDCRMRTNGAPAFCPVCQRALRRMIDFYTCGQ